MAVMAAGTLMPVSEISKDYDLIEFTIDGEVVAAVSTNSCGDRTLTIELEPRELTLRDVEFLHENSDMQRAVNITQADVEVQSLLSRGVSIKKAVPEFTPYWAIIDSEKFDPLLYRMTKDLGAIVLLEQGNEHWIARIDLAEEKVKSLERLTE
jgi:hypothetical protein